MLVKFLTLWNLLPRKFDYVQSNIDEEIDEFLQNLTTHLNESRIFTERQQHLGDGYIDNSLDLFHDSVLNKTDHLMFAIHERQIECLEKLVYPRWLLFSMKFKGVREKLTIVLLGDVFKLKMNWDLICHEIVTVSGDCVQDWSKDLKWIDYSLGIISNDLNSSDQSTSRELSNQITVLNLANENALYNLNKTETISCAKYSDKTSSDYSDYTSEDLITTYIFNNVSEKERLIQSCPDLSTANIFDEELEMSFVQLRPKNKKKTARKLFCSMCFSMSNVNDGSLYIDKNNENGLDLDIKRIKGNKKKEKKKEKIKGPIDLVRECSEFNNDTNITEQTMTDMTFGSDSDKYERAGSNLPPYTEPTDPTSPAYHFLIALKASESSQDENIEQMNSSYIDNLALSNDFEGSTEQMMSPMTRNDEQNLPPITEITENCANNENSDNTSKMIGNISMSGDSTMSNSSTSNPWGEESIIQNVETNNNLFHENKLTLSSDDPVKIEINTAPSPLIFRLRSNNSTSTNNGISLTGPKSPNIMTRSILLTGSSVESDKTRQSRVSKRSKDNKSIKTPQRKRSISPVYRDDVSRLSYRFQHVSRIDQPITRRRTNSTRNYNEFFPYEDEEQFYMKRPGLSMTQRQSRNPSLVMPIEADEMLTGDMPSREASSERRGEIKSTQLPDGGWLTGVFTWLGGSRAATPLIGRRENFQTTQSTRYRQNDDNTSDECDETFNSDENGPRRIVTSASLDEIQLGAATQSNDQQPNRRESRSIIPYTSRSEYNYPSQTLQTDFVISLINPISDRPLRHLPRHVYWIHTSVAPTQQRLSQIMAEYRSNIPRVYEKVKSVVSDNRTKIACLFIGTALFVPTAHHLIPLNGDLTADSAISYRFGNMINLLRPSLLWTGSAVISKFRPGLYSIRPNP